MSRCSRCARRSRRSERSTVRRCARGWPRGFASSGDTRSCARRRFSSGLRASSARSAARDRRDRGRAGTDERPGRPAALDVRRRPGARCVPLTARPAAAPGPGSPAARALDVDRLRALPRLAERVRARSEHRPHCARDPVDGLGRQRLPARDDAGSTAGTSRQRAQHDHPRHRAARPAGRRRPPRRDHRSVRRSPSSPPSASCSRCGERSARRFAPRRASTSSRSCPSGRAALEPAGSLRPAPNPAS